MRLGRRELLKLGVANAVLAGVPLNAKSEGLLAIRRAGPSVLQGATDETRAQFSIAHDAGLPLNVYAVKADGSMLKPDAIYTHGFQGHNTIVTKVYVSGLALGQDYKLVLAHKQTGALIETRLFRALNLSKPNFRVGICSCMDDYRHDAQIWNDLAASAPDILFFIGDAVYADRKVTGPADPAELWRRFCDARATLEFYFLKRLIPVLATWDDHDFGHNNSGKEYPFVAESQKNFHIFFAQDEGHSALAARGPGVSQALRLGGQQFILADCRSYRLPKGSTDRFAHWGREQETWILDLVRSHAGPSWVMNGSQIFPQTSFRETMARQHAANLAGFVAELKELKKKVVFASGDVHYSEISRIKSEVLGYETYEITSSAVHSIAPPGFPATALNSMRIVGTSANNFIVADTSAASGRLELNVTSLGKNAKVRFNQKLSV
ncbi:MAG TPA: alkaline phosphatase D family protein [Bdellovibrionales bacterium]|nr:alkaline phosphatase D family protein [Bdellovibrionales bacterium]